MFSEKLNQLDYFINLHRNFDICSDLVLIFGKLVRKT